MEWGGVKSTYTIDQSDLVQRVFKCAESLASSSDLSIQQTRRVSVIPTPKLRCSKTIYFNLAYVQIKGNSSEWSFDANGVYDNHPTAKDLNNNPLKCCLVGIGSIASTSVDTVVCYRDRKDISQLALYCAQSYALELPVTVKAQSGIIGYASYSKQDTLRQAQVHIADVSFIGFGIGFCNGDYSWGYEFDNCKFSDNYYAVWLVNGIDNGERFSFNHCIMQNNVNAIWNQSWGGFITVFGGSYVWNDGEYFHIGPSMGAYLRPNHVEYVTSTAPIITTAANVTSNDFPVYRQVRWVGGMLAIARVDGKTLTQNIPLIVPGSGSEVIMSDVSAYWSSVDFTPNMRIAPDVYPWDTSIGRVVVNNVSMTFGSWGILGRCKSLMHVSQPGMLNNQTNTTITDGATITWPNRSVSDRTLVFTASSTVSSPNTITLDIPVSQAVDYFAVVPCIYFDTLTTNKSDWTITFYTYDSRLGFGSNTTLGTANLASGVTEVYPINIYNRPAQVLKKEMATYSTLDTFRVVINMPTGWSSSDNFTIRAAGGIII